MGTAHAKPPFLLDKPEHHFKKSICARTKGTIRGQNKGTSRALRARVAASTRGLRIFLISTSRRRASTRPRMSTPRLRMSESPVRQVTDTPTRSHTPEGPKPKRSARQVRGCSGAPGLSRVRPTAKTCNNPDFLSDSRFLKKISAQ